MQHALFEGVREARARSRFALQACALKSALAFQITPDEQGWNFSILRFMEDANIDNDFLFPFHNLQTVLNNLTLRKFAYIWQIERDETIAAMKFDNTRIHPWKDVFVAVVVAFPGEVSRVNQRLACYRRSIVECGAK